MEGTLCALHAFPAHCGEGKKEDGVTLVLRTFISSLGGGGGVKSYESY